MIRNPPDGWWFVQRGPSSDGTVASLIAGTHANVGNRPANFVIMRTCSTDLVGSFPGQDIGGGSHHFGKWVGSLKARSKSENDRESVTYVAYVPTGECTWIVVCEGDAGRDDRIKPMCDRMLFSVEFNDR